MDVQRYLTEQGVEFELVRHEQAFSAQEVAAAEHVTGHMFAKTVIVQGGGTAHMLVLPASRHVDMKAAGGLVELVEDYELAVVHIDELPDVHEVPVPVELAAPGPCGDLHAVLVEPGGLAPGQPEQGDDAGYHDYSEQHGHEYIEAPELVH